MSQGFLILSEEEPGATMLKDDPEDLNCLAPAAGDACIPLDDQLPIYSDMFLDDILLKDNSLGSFLGAEDPSDPYMSYREYRDSSPQLLSPNNMSKSSDCSIPSLCSPNSSLLDEEMSTFMSLQVEDETDLVMKAPYIPMNLSDDLPLLGDLMWNNQNEKNNSSCFSKSHSGGRLQEGSTSTLAQMLGTNGSKRNGKCTDRGGGGGMIMEDTGTEMFDDSEKMTTDASNKALGATLANDDGSPVAYISRQLNKAEMNYPVIEKELLGIVFAEPQLPEPWTGTKDATKPGETCYSRSDISPEIVGSEDCLYLNVYIKKIPTPDSPLKPVMVWMYGGGLTLGTSRPGVYGPKFLLMKDIILVSFNYRLGILGFLSITDPKLGVPGNLGLKDQNFALKWVQRNIKSFGGNPNDVTIFGNSAGSASVHAHILSPASRGLFHKAIMQSGTTLNSWFWGSKDNVEEIAEKAGRNVSSQREALEVLKKLPVEELFAAQEKVKDSPFPSDRRPFSAVQEYPNPTAFLTESPVEIIKKSKYNHVPILMGYTMNEGMLLDFDVDFAKKNGIEYPPFVFQRLVPIDLNVTVDSEDNKKILNILKRLYEDKVDSKGLEHHDPMTDSYMLVGIVETIRQHLKNTHEPIYVYRMSLAGELNFLKRLLNRTEEPGVCHGDELGYLFDSEVTVPISQGSMEDKSIHNFVNMWTNFAIHGNPVKNIPKVTWKPVENDRDIKVLDIGEELNFVDMPEKDRMNVWRNEILKSWPLVKFS